MNKIELADKILETNEEFIEQLFLFKEKGTMLFKNWKRSLEECNDPVEKTALAANFEVC